MAALSVISARIYLLLATVIAILFVPLRFSSGTLLLSFLASRLVHFSCRFLGLDWYTFCVVFRFRSGILLLSLLPSQLVHFCCRFFTLWWYTFRVAFLGLAGTLCCRQHSKMPTLTGTLLLSFSGTLFVSPNT